MIWAQQEDLHVVQSTRALAMDALAVVRANDDVAQRGAILEDEDGILVTAFGLLVAGRRLAVPLGHLAIKLLARGDGPDGRQVGGAGGRGELGLQVGVGLRGRESRGEEERQETGSHFGVDVISGGGQRGEG